MDVISYKTLSANPNTIQKEWYVIDAEGQVLGRLASEIAKLLRGKHKPDFTPHADCGDHVIVINADKVKLTGKKWTDRVYLSYTGYPGGQRSITPKELLVKHPHALVEKSVKGMLPKNKLGRQIFKNLHVYTDAEHPHAGQQPKEIKL